MKQVIKLSKKEEQLEKIVRKQVEEEYKELVNETLKYKDLMDYYQKEYNKIQKEYELLNNEYLEAENLDNLALKKQNNKLKKQQKRIFTYN